ncbi:NTE family protein [Rhodoblastus acidophilus]|uniref:NTE family protein n=1 Tax=Rhodoblastus acidophilus TaxID=1074 RepID=A0A212RK51_RHOAC|nr:patatin-like phospholipase family protein [Rhodoblastus acidophilus]PPQ35085.1 patatin [Rhodoblastus acidophilus]RAI20736.1 patatin [Rhodoblastus acidophilus]SNB72785.1 NTE family protein [Rhodoblastus acidophilus]
MTAAPRKTINLALQGGGAHGAFTWGVLDALLDDGRFDVTGLSGTSAGAMNAVNFAEGLRKGGASGAKAQLAAFWKGASLDGDLPKAGRMVIDGLMACWSATPAAALMQQTASLFAPAELNPMDINPLRHVLRDGVDFDKLRASAGPKLFIAATAVETGKVRVFHREELTLDMVMASACLPTVFRAVEIDGEPYWDGGYMGNPVLFPFFYETSCVDIILVQINPITRKGAPDTAAEIAGRVDEITFNASLLQELRAIDFVRRLIAEGRLTGTAYKAIRVHVIEAQDELNQFGAASKMNADYDFFLQLREIGVKAAQRFVAAHYDDIGVRPTLDLRETLS